MKEVAPVVWILLLAVGPCLNITHFLGTLQSSVVTAPLKSDILFARVREYFSQLF